MDKLHLYCVNKLPNLKPSVAGDPVQPIMDLSPDGTHLIEIGKRDIQAEIQDNAIGATPAEIVNVLAPNSKNYGSGFMTPTYVKDPASIPVLTDVSYGRKLSEADYIGLIRGEMERLQKLASAPKSDAKKEGDK